MAVRPITRGQKRKRSAEVDPVTESTPPPEPPWKKAGFRSAEEANTAFWDNVSKVPLFPGALKEFDRRNLLAVGFSIKSAPGSIRRNTRSTARRATLIDQLICQNSTASGDCAAQLKRFARRGGPDLRDLRGHPEPEEAFPIMPSRKTPYKPPTPSDSSESSQIGRRTSAYNPVFEQNLINHGIYPHGYRHPNGHRPPKPNNWDDIQQRLTRARPSLSPSRFSDGAFERFVDKNTEALNESEVMTNVFPIIRGDSNIPSGINRLFGNMAPLTDGTIVDPQPDFYYGAHPQQLDPSVKTQLSSYIVPSTNPNAPIAANNFTEGKGPSGTAAVVKRQVLQDGAMGARTMNYLQSYSQPEPVYDNNAYTITSSYSNGQLMMYTTHPTAPANPGGQPEYHMNQLRSFAMNDMPETFRQGATAYRNARDWTKEKRDEFIEAANERARTLPQNMSFDSSGYGDPSASRHGAATPESEISEDELALNHATVAPRAGKRVKRGQPERNDRGYRSDRRDRSRR